jgi:hypothetical protein
MRTVLCVGLLALTLNGCLREQDARATLMASIEARIRLPDKSLTLDRYARYYARGANDNVEALYAIPAASFLDDVREYCQRTQRLSMPCAPGGKSGLVGAGQRKWLSDFRDLPVSHGGGCGEIRFAFDPRREVFSPLECNPGY